MRLIKSILSKLESLNDKKLMTKWRCVIDGIMQEYFVKNSWMLNMNNPNGVTTENRSNIEQEEQNLEEKFELNMTIGNKL